MSSSSMRPLISVSMSERRPVVKIPKKKRDALTLCAYERAKNGPGSIENHELGLFGEYALALYFGEPDAVDTDVYEYGDGGVDLTINGRTIDVKTAGPQANNPELWVSKDCPLRADHYVLVHQLSPSAYQIVGYAPQKIVEQAPVRRITMDEYRKRVRAVSRDMLWPV